MWAARLNRRRDRLAAAGTRRGYRGRTRTGEKTAPRPPGAGGGWHGVGIVRGGVPPQGEQQPQPGGMTPLLFAARDGSWSGARARRRGRESERRRSQRMTPLMMAITNDKLPVAQLLVDKGREVKAADWYGRTSLGPPSTSAISMCAPARRRTASIVRRCCELITALSTRAPTSTPASKSSRRSGVTCCRWFARVGRLHRTDSLHACRAVGRVTVMRLLLVERRESRHHDVQRHHRAHGGGGCELGCGQTFTESPSRGWKPCGCWSSSEGMSTR